jgi:phage protein D
MGSVRAPGFKVLYNEKSITADITPYLVSITYTDAVVGKSDGVQLELSNSTGVWLDEWYPIMGDTLTVSMGFDNYQFNCGTFEIDEIEWHFAPDVIMIKGIASGIKKATRTLLSDQHENKTLRQIIEKVATRNGYTIAGNIQDTGALTRETQNMETDLGFLKRLADTYGHSFSVRGDKLIFTNIYELEALASATTITRLDLCPGSHLRDKSYDTYKKVHVRHFDPMAKRVYETEFEFPEIVNSDGFAYNGIVKKDVKEVRVRVDGMTDAKLKAIAALHSSNSKQQEGVLIMNGNPYVVAGNNFTLEQCGKLSGDYHVMASTHHGEPGSGYITTAQVKRVGYIIIEKTKRKKPKKVKPLHVNIVKN